MSKIEPGCLCISTQPETYGTCVTAESPISKEDSDRMRMDTKSQVWKIDKDIPWFSFFGETYMPFMSEHYLRRIDDGDFQKDVTEKQKDLTV